MAISVLVPNFRNNLVNQFDWTESIQLNQFNLIEPSWFNWTESVWVDSIAKMDSWQNFKLFRPKLSPNRTKNGHFLAIFGLDRSNLVRFGLNLGLNNLKFDKEAIFDTLKWLFWSCHTVVPDIFVSRFVSYRFAKHETQSFPIHKTDTKISRINRF